MSTRQLKGRGNWRDCLRCRGFDRRPLWTVSSLFQWVCLVRFVLFGRICNTCNLWSNFDEVLRTKKFDEYITIQTSWSKPKRFSHNGPVDIITICNNSYRSKSSPQFYLISNVETQLPVKFSLVKCRYVFFHDAWVQPIFVSPTRIVQTCSNDTLGLWTSLHLKFASLFLILITLSRLGRIVSNATNNYRRLKIERNFVVFG